MEQLGAGDPQGDHLGEAAPLGCGQVYKERRQGGWFIASSRHRGGRGGAGGAGAGQDVPAVPARTRLRCSLCARHRSEPLIYTTFDARGYPVRSIFHSVICIL